MTPPATLSSLPSSAPGGPARRFSLPMPNPTRIRSYLLRLPLFTRLVLLAIVVFWVLELQAVWSVLEWGRLEPEKIGLTTGGTYRLNTYPFIHKGFWHMLFNVLALTGLLERFEMEWGTLNSLALFLGPLSSLPGVLYILIESGVLRIKDSVVGASVWIFLLLSIESIKTYRANPHFDIASYKIPTWISPLALALAMWILVPGTSLVGHLCGCLVGYLFGLGYLKFLAPPEKILRWIEGKLNLLARLPHYVSVDQKTYGRYGVLPSSGRPSDAAPIGMGWLGSGGQRLGP